MGAVCAVVTVRVAQITHHRDKTLSKVPSAAFATPR
jgi:hypothetical protein